VCVYEDIGCCKSLWMISFCLKTLVYQSSVVCSSCKSMFEYLIMLLALLLGFNQLHCSCGMFNHSSFVLFSVVNNKGVSYGYRVSFADPVAVRHALEILSELATRDPYAVAMALGYIS
jgi:hypothetical protein